MGFSLDLKLAESAIKNYKAAKALAYPPLKERMPVSTDITFTS